jgi:hypothetical protein
MAYDLIGWFGAVLGIAAYGLAARGTWAASGWRSAVANIVAGACLMVNGIHHTALPSVGLNVVWVLVGLATLFRVRARNRTVTSPVVGVTLDVEK